MAYLCRTCLCAERVVTGQVPEGISRDLDFSVLRFSTIFLSMDSVTYLDSLDPASDS